MKMEMMKSLLVVFCLVFLTGNAYGAVVEIEESRAFQQYKKRPKSEMSKILYLMDRFQSTDFTVLYNGTEVKAKIAMREAKKYMAKHYKRNEEAVRWIKAHAYRSKRGGQIIYLRFDNGDFQPLRDVLINELTLLSKIG